MGSNRIIVGNFSLLRSLCRTKRVFRYKGNEIFFKLTATGALPPPLSNPHIRQSPRNRLCFE